jgi:hypothetical protein
MAPLVTHPVTERRRDRRHARPEAHGILSARVRPGYDVSLIDVSAGGVLVESDRRLMPGAPVELHFRVDHGSEIVRGRVVRCAVARLQANSICYRGAVAFDRPLPWIAAEISVGYPVPGPERRPD